MPIRAIGPAPPRQIFEWLDDTLGPKQRRQGFFACVSQFDIIRQLAHYVEPGLDWTMVEVRGDLPCAGQAIVLIVPLKMGLDLAIRKARPPDDSRCREEVSEGRQSKSSLGSSSGQREHISNVVYEVKAALRYALLWIFGPG